MSIVHSRMVLGIALWLVAPGVMAVSLEVVKPERHPAVDALPSFARVGKAGDTIFNLRGRLSEVRAGKIEKAVLALKRDVKRRFFRNRDKSGLRPVDVCLFARSRSYVEFAALVTGTSKYGMDRGFFVPYRRLVIVDLSRGLGALRHELVHVLLRDDLGTLPDWLDEGIASLYVSVKPAKRGLEFLTDHRLGQLRTARAEGKLPTLEKLVSIDDREMYGPDYPVYYALSRFVLLYLDRRGKLESFMKTVLSRRRTKAWQLQVLKSFVEFSAFGEWIEML